MTEFMVARQSHTPDVGPARMDGKGLLVGPELPMVATRKSRWSALDAGVTEHHLLYSTHLYYVPRPPESAIVQTSSAIVHIKCCYPRGDNVSSQVVWVPFSSMLTTGRFLSYSLRQMNDNWDVERASNLYNLGEFIYIEASVMAMSHQPLRLYVDSCVATLTADKDSTPRYHLIDFNGCLMDSKAGDSCSCFVSPRTHPDKLRIKLCAFRFPNGGSSLF
ncbi:zona pellucida sperm-binding protein 3-like [Cetorhinus maximus]